jgi:biopolymer transport protein ExbD
MSILRKKRSKSPEETDLDVVPVMNMFLVLIPFLLMFASFFHLKVINTSVPVLSETMDEAKIKKSEIKLTVVVEIKSTKICVSAISDEIKEDALKNLESTIDRKEENESMALLEVSLKKIKADYPASDTVIIIPEDDVIYDTIIQTMDVARYSNENPLFPKVVLSGKVG